MPLYVYHLVLYNHLCSLFSHIFYRIWWTGGYDIVASTINFHEVNNDDNLHLILVNGWKTHRVRSFKEYFISCICSTEDSDCCRVVSTNVNSMQFFIIIRFD